MSDSADDRRPVEVKILLSNGKSKKLTLPANHSDLRALISINGGGPSAGDVFFQIPIDGGRGAFSFRSQHLVAVETRPAVLVESLGVVEDPVSPRWLEIDNFLSAEEHDELLSYALSRESEFEAGTVEGKRSQHRQNLVDKFFRESELGERLTQRVLSRLDEFFSALGTEHFVGASSEAQLTANNQGDYYRPHADADHHESPSGRRLTWVYYFHRRPRGFSGGHLRLWDSQVVHGSRQIGEGFRDLAVVDNSLVVFESNAFHEVRPVECRSGAFADSRFSVTGWIHGPADGVVETASELGGAFVKASGVIEGRVADSLLIFAPGRSEAHPLDGAGQAIWALLDGARDLDAVVAQLAAEPAGDAGVTRSEVEKVFASLLAIGAIESV